MTKAQIVQRFKNALENMVESGKQELRNQGHKRSGTLINSIEAKIESDDLDKMVAVILAEDYGLIVDSGVRPSRVPFSGAGGGGTSQYIQGLIEFVEDIRPGLSDEETLSFVFAIAHTQRREGIPTSGSFSYTNNGRRTEWIKYGLEEYVPALENDLRLFDLMSRIIEDKVQSASN